MPIKDTNGLINLIILERLKHGASSLYGINPWPLHDLDRSYLSCSDQNRKFRFDCLPTDDKRLSMDMAPDKLKSHLQEQQTWLCHLHPPTSDVSGHRVRQFPRWTTPECMIFSPFREDEGHDLVGKRGSEFKLPYPIIDTDPSGLGSALEEEEYTKLKSPKSKKSKGQLRDYLQAGRKRKTPYRDVYNGINGYSPYAGINGYPTCQTGDMKTEYLYPYAGQNFALDTADLYRSGYHTFATAGSMYSSSDSLRLEADKHAYANGYYIEPRQYQHTLQYHGNGYSDLMAQTTKYGYDMSKYGYDHMGSYGLDLTKRGHYEDDLTRYESDLRKYSDYTATASDKLSRMNGTYDPLRTGSLYGTNAFLNNDGLLSCSMTSHGSSSPCALYRTDTSSADRYNPRDGTKIMPTSSSADPSAREFSKSSSQLTNGHTSVIRNASPRTKSPPTETPSTLYPSPSDSLQATQATNGSRASWASCSSNSGANRLCGSNVDGASSPLQAQAAHQLSSAALASRIISPGAKQDGGAVGVEALGSQNNPSPASATTATSVIQQSSRHRWVPKAILLMKPEYSFSKRWIYVQVMWEAVIWRHCRPCGEVIRSMAAAKSWYIHAR